MENSIPQNKILTGTVKFYGTRETPDFGVITMDGNKAELSFKSLGQSGVRIRNGQVTLIGLPADSKERLYPGTPVVFTFEGGYSRRTNRPFVASWCHRGEYVAMQRVLDHINELGTAYYLEQLNMKRDIIRFQLNPEYRCIEQEMMNGKPTGKPQRITFQGRRTDLDFAFRPGARPPVVTPGKLQSDGHQYNRWFERLTFEGWWVECNNPREEFSNFKLQPLTPDEVITLLSTMERRDGFTHSRSFSYHEVTWRNHEGQVIATYAGAGIRFRESDWYAETMITELEMAQAMLHVGSPLSAHQRYLKQLEEEVQASSK